MGGDVASFFRFAICKDDDESLTKIDSDFLGLFELRNLAPQSHTNYSMLVGHVGRFNFGSSWAGSIQFITHGLNNLFDFHQMNAY
jgi:hypothetical protein